MSSLHPRSKRRVYLSVVSCPVDQYNQLKRNKKAKIKSLAKVSDKTFIMRHEAHGLCLYVMYRHDGSFLSILPGSVFGCVFLRKVCVVETLHHNWVRQNMLFQSTAEKNLDQAHAKV